MIVFKSYIYTKIPYQTILISVCDFDIKKKKGMTVKATLTPVIHSTNGPKNNFSIQITINKPDVMKTSLFLPRAKSYKILNV